MTTRTLGVKFEVDGFRQVAKSLREIEARLDRVLASSDEFKQSQKAVNDTQKLAATSLARSNNRVKDSYKQLERQIAQNIRATTKQFKASARNTYIRNFGTVAERQNLIITEEKEDFRQRKTYRPLNNNNRALILEFRLAYRQFFSELKTVLEDSFPDNNEGGFWLLDKIFGAISGVGGAIASTVLFPVEQIFTGLFSQIGETLSREFAQGMVNNLQKSLGLPFESVGADIGGVVGKGVYRMYDSILKRTKEAILADSDDYTPQVRAIGIDLKNTLLEALLRTMAIPVRAHKRIQMRKRGVPQFKEQLGDMLTNKQISEEDKAEIAQKQSITLLTGGVTMDSEGNNTEFVERLMRPYLTDTYIDTVKNPWSNSPVGEEYQAVTSKLIAKLLSNESINSNLKNFLQNSGFQEDFAKISQDKNFQFNENDDLVAAVVKFLQQKDIPVFKLLETAYEGFNQDDLQIAATAAFYREQFPDKPVNLIGTSAGGHNVAGALELLQLIGYSQIKAAGISTPISGLEFTGNEDNYLATLGTSDFLYKAIYETIFKDVLTPPEYMNVLEGGGLGHMLPAYLADPKFQARFAEFMKDQGVGIRPDVGLSEMGYLTRIGQFPEKENLQRTLMRHLGEPTDAGYYFSNSNDLRGLAKDLRKKSKRVKNTDLKTEAENLIEFIEVLATEIEQLKLLGDKYKPTESLKAAAKVFPELEPKIAKYFGQGVPQPVRRAVDRQVAENKPYIDFKQKLESELPLFERTIRHLLGQAPTEGQYSFYNESDKNADSLGGLIDYLKDVLLLDATPKQKAKSVKYVQFLEKLKAAIVARGKTGAMPDSAFLAEAEQLFGFNLEDVKSVAAEPHARGVRVQQQRTSRHDTETVVENYREHLQQVVDEIEAEAIDNLETLIASPSSLGVDEIRQLFNEITTSSATPPTLLERMREYRQAVSETRFEAAKALGEALIVDLAVARRLVDSLASRAGQQNPYTTAGAARSARANLTRMQNEIIRGDQGVGRTAQGLPDLAINNRELQRLVRETMAGISLGLSRSSGEEIGEEFGSGLIDGTEGSLGIQSPSKVFKRIGQYAAAGMAFGLNRTDGQEIGEEFGSGVATGTQNSLEIRSPSRLFEWLGEMVQRGFANGVSGIEDTVNFGREAGENLARELDAAVEFAFQFVTGRVERRQRTLGERIGDIGSFFGDLIGGGTENELEGFDQVANTPGLGESIDQFASDALQNLSNALQRLEQRFPVLHRIRTAIASLGVVVLQALGIYALNDALFNFAVASLESAAAAEALSRVIVNLSGNSTEAADNLQFIRLEARKLKVDLNAAAQSYSGLLGAAKNTSLEGEQVRRIFSAFAATATARGLSAEDTRGMFIALEQIISKGELRSEEVKGQMAERLPGIQTTIATALGVSSGQLQQMMESGSLKAADVLPKVAAQLEAENVAASVDTVVAAQTSLNNALFELKAAFGKPLQPVQKLGLNKLADALDFVRERAGMLTKVFVALSTTLTLIVVKSFINLRLAAVGLGIVLDQVLATLAAARAAIINFLRRFILVYAAIETLSNVYELTRNGFPELQKDIETTTEKLRSLQQAFKDAANSGNDFNTSLPSTNRDLQLNQGWELPDNWFGNILRPIVGGDRVNFEGLRRRVGLTTQAEKLQNDFRIGTSELMGNANAVVMAAPQVKDDVEAILEFDAELREVQSARLNLLPGDRAGLEASLEAEKEILKERDKYLKVTAEYQQNLNANIQAVENAIAQLERMAANGEVSSSVYDFLSTQLDQTLEDLEQTKTTFEDITSALSRQLSEFERRLSSLNQRLVGFREASERNLTVGRTEIIQSGVEEGQSDAVIQLELDDLQRRDLENRVKYLKGELTKLERDLASPEFAANLKRLQQQAQERGSTLDSSATIEEFLAENRSSGEIQALEGLNAARDLRSELAQTQESLAQSLQQSRFAVTDLVRSVDDFFFRLTQQIKQAFVEMQQIFNTLSFTRMRGELMRAIVPGSNNFFNSVIEAVQSVLDEAQQIAERAFEQQNNLINFEGERYDLNTSLNDFIRQIAGASEAVMNFRRALGDNSINSSGIGGDGTSGITSGLETGRTAHGREFISRPVSSAIGVYEVSSSTSGGRVDAFTGNNLLPHHTYQIDPWGYHVVDLILSQNGKTNVPVPAAASGKVTAASYNDIAGNFVIVEQSDGHKTKYVHLDKISVKVDDQIKIGQAVGIQGNTGRSTRTHLHFASTDPNLALEYARGLESGTLRDRTSVVNNQSVQLPHTPMATNIKLGQYNIKNTNQIVEHLRQAGFTPAGIAAALGAFSQESSLNPYAENKNLPVGQRPYGLAQWRLNRRTNMPPITGNEETDLTNQLNYFLEELKGKNNEGKNGELLRILTTSNDLVQTNKAMAAYERFHNYQNYGVGREWGDRIKWSQVAFDQLKKLPTPSPQTVNSSRTSHGGEAKGPHEASITVSSDPTRGSTELTDALIKQREFNLEQQQRVLEVERDLFKDRTRSEQERLRREALLNIEDTARQLTQSGDQLEDLQISNSPPNIQQQVEQQQRNAMRAFDDMSYETYKQVMDAEDRVRATKSFLAGAPSQIQRLRDEGTSESNTAADFIQSQFLAAQEYLPEYERQLAELKAIFDRIPEVRDGAELFQREEAQLAIEADSIQKSLNQLQPIQEIAAVTSGLDAQKELELQKLQLEYAQKINQLQKEERGNPEYLDALLQRERELLEIRSRAVEMDYQGREVEQRQAVQNLEQSIGAAQSQKLESVGLTFESAEIQQQNAVLAENLRYRQEILEITRKYQGQPELIWEMTAQARRLNELNLENIDRQFKSLGETLEEQALSGITQVLEGFFSLELNLKSIILSIAKSFASLAAQNVAGGIARMIGLNFRDGGTIPNFKNGGRILPDGVSNTLRNNVPGIRDAFQREGNGGVLAVFKPGEEVLPLNGEAQRYQALKARLGKNPLREVFAGNFKEGGTVDVGSMALGRIRDKNPSLIYSLPRGKMKDNNTVNRPVTVNATIVTPDADSYRASRYQIEREMAETYRRSLR